MLLTSHALVGAAISVATGDPYAGFAGGVLSHHLLDMVPHFDQGTFRLERSRAPYLTINNKYTRFPFNKRDWLILFADFATAGILLSIIFKLLPPNLWPLIFFGALGGIVPDTVGSSPLWSEQLESKFKSARIYKTFHTFFHFTVSPSLIWLGMATQFIVVGLSLVYLLK